MTIERPRFKYCFHPEPMDPEYVMLLTETKAYALEGRAYRHLGPLLTGEHTVDDLVERLEDVVPAPEIFYALDVLEKKGYIVDADPARPPQRSAFWNVLDLDGATAESRLASARVAVSGVGDVTTERLMALLDELGVARGDGGPRVVLTDDHGRAALGDLNREALSTRRPWMLIKPVGAVLWLGPVFVPGRTACWECLASRLRGNRQVEAYVVARNGHSDTLRTSLPALPVTLELAVSLAATEVAKWVSRGRSDRLEGRIVTVDLLSLELQEHVVVRRPQCPACGDPAPRPARPVVLSTAGTRTAGDGRHRAETAEETWRRLRHHVSPVSGLVASLVRKDPGENGVTYSYAAGHEFPMWTRDLGVLRANLRFRSGGKGMTDVQARVAAVCEAIERHSGVFRGDEPTVRASRRGLGEEAVPLEDVLLFSEAQFRHRHEWNARCSHTHYHVVPERLGDDEVVDWTALWSLTGERFRYLPAAYCYYGHPEARRFFCAADANGTSAGATLEDAIVRAFLELVERDSVALWWYNRARRPSVDLDSVRLPYVAALRDHYQGLLREVWVLDITSDLGIPVCAAVSRRTDRPVEDIVVGFGAHLDPEVALLRSLVEVNQFLPALSRTGHDGATRYAYDDPDALAWWRTATIASEPYLVADPSARARRLDELPRPGSGDPARDVEACVRIASEHGMETLVLDQTRPDVDLAVARVVVPGLRHFWRRLGPGRLYDVPVKLGWTSGATREDDMNPFSVFF